MSSSGLRLFKKRPGLSTACSSSVALASVPIPALASGLVGALRLRVPRSISIVSGYSDMAIGMSMRFRHLSCRFNFNSPYKAPSIVDLAALAMTLSSS